MKRLPIPASTNSRGTCSGVSMVSLSTNDLCLLAGEAASPLEPAGEPLGEDPETGTEIADPPGASAAWPAVPAGGGRSFRAARRSQRQVLRPHPESSPRSRPQYHLCRAKIEGRWNPQLLPPGVPENLSPQ